MSKKFKNKAIITCAVTGAMHTPTMSDFLPYTPEDIAKESLAAAEAGAAIIHLHARDVETGQPTGDPDVFNQFLPVIKESTDAVINITTGGSPTMAVSERIAGPEKFAPEMCSLNMGSLNFAIFPAGRRIKEWKFSWEKDYVESSKDFIFRNTFGDIEYILETLGSKGTKFEHECYDVGHLYNLAHFLDRGLIKPPFFVQNIFGILGGIGTDLDNLMFMKQTADRLFGKDTYQWSVLAAGRFQMPFATQAALMGGNVRVGLEDSLSIGPGKLAESNVDQVEKIKKILAEMHLEPATPAEAREMLDLKGADNVNF